MMFRGRVQGVFFRANTQRKASGAGLCGYVRNLDDGSVEALFEGEQAVIERVLDEIGRGVAMGAALVREKEVRWLEAAGRYDGFIIGHEE